VIKEITTVKKLLLHYFAARNKFLSAKQNLQVKYQVKYFLGLKTDNEYEMGRLKK